MAVTPEKIIELALARHRQTWNWTLHFAGLCCFALTLLLHSYLLFAVTLIVFGAGFFELKLPVTGKTRWTRFVDHAIEWELNWVAAPWNWPKIWRFGVTVLLILINVWALWTRDAVVLALMVGFGYLIHVMRENKAGGIKP